MDHQTQELVKKSSLFKNVSTPTLNEVMTSCLPRSVEQDNFFFLQGDPAAFAYVLIEGRVKMIHLAPNGNQITLRIITPGQTYGGIALLEPEDGYPVTAQAEVDSTALAWESATLRKLAEKAPAISLNIMGLMHGYISELQERQQGLTGGRVEQRIARNLLKLAAQAASKVEEGLLIDIPITRQDIAEMSGTTLFTVSRTLNEWERSGLLSIGRERVVIRNPHQLVRIADDLIPKE